MASRPGKKIVLITGATSGIGFELAAQLLAKGTYHVLLGTRSAAKGTAALRDLRSRDLPGSAEVLALDLTVDPSISGAAETVSTLHGRLDILVNNAGIALTSPPPSSSSLPPSTTDPTISPSPLESSLSALRDTFQTSFNTNATGPALVTTALAPILRSTAQRSSGEVRIVNVSSGAGSIARYARPETPRYPDALVAYQASKAALNMVTVAQHREFAGEGIRVFAFCPGFTASSLSPGTTVENGARAVGEAVRPLVEIVEGERDEEAGGFLREGGDHPW